MNKNYLLLACIESRAKFTEQQKKYDCLINSQKKITKSLQFKQKENLSSHQIDLSYQLQIQKQKPSRHQFSKQKISMKKCLVIVSLLIMIIKADIRLDNVDLSADGQWTISYNPNGAKEIQEALGSQAVINEPSNQGSITDQSQQQAFETKDELDDGLDSQEEESVSQSSQEIEQQQQPNIPFYTDINIFQHLTQTSGTCLVFFYDSVISDTLNNKQKADSLSIRFHDPKYLDQKIIVLKIALQNYIIETDLWEIATSTVNYTLYEELEQKMHGSMQVAYKVEKGWIKLYVEGYEVAISYVKKQYSLGFPIFGLVVTFLTLYAVMRFEKRQIPIQKISIITLYHNVFFYIYLSTFFLIVGMAALPQPMSLLLICGCIQILISVKMIRKFETIIQRVANIDGYCIFYCSIFVYVWLLFSYFYNPVFILANCLFLVPQIVHNVRMGNKLGPEYEYLGILVSPQVYFLYLKGYPQNLLHYHPQPLVCVGIIFLVTLQLWIVHNQNLKGPFFFIKKSWLPNYYNYYHEFKLDSKCQLYDQECAICLCLLTENDPITANEIKENCLEEVRKTDEDLNTQGSQVMNDNKKITLMVTPCQHKFHPLCLEQWIQYKRECPVDRKVLPIVYK